MLKTIDNFVSRHITGRQSIQLLTHNVLSLRINCDGIPLHRSSRVQFWPILINFQCEGLKPNCSPVVVGIFYGMKNKTNDVNEFLKDFIDEFQLLSNGYKFGEHLIPVHVTCFICDAPARHFLKKIFLAMVTQDVRGVNRWGNIRPELWYFHN